MTNFSRFFDRLGEPADEARLDEIEQAIGRKLPEDYRALIRETGGGTLSLNNCVMPGLPEKEGRLSTDEIFGNGTDENTRTLDLATYATFLMEEWEIAEEVLLFATSEAGMHVCFVINYDLPDYPAGAVLYLDTDPDGEMLRVADSVTDFLNALEPYYEGNQDNEDANQADLVIEGVWHGVLSEDLQGAIAATPTSDIEHLLRKAAVPLANPFNLSMTKGSAEERRFQDVLYWIAQHVNPQDDADSYSNFNEKDTEANIGKLLAWSFLAKGQRNGFLYSYNAVDLWWESRIREGVLKETLDGYVLDKDYISSVLEELRQEKQ